SITATFDSDFIGASKAANDNEAELTLTGTAATALTIVSGGENASNILNYTSGTDKLTTVTITGSSDLDLDLGTGSAKIATVDASGLTGGLTFDTAQLKAASGATAFDGGVVKLGAGDDVISVVTGVKISGFGLGE